MRRKDGTVFPTEYSMMPIRDEIGRLVGWVSVVQDITERKRVDEELRQLPWRIIEAQETERLRVARELHDGVNQVIASVKMRLHQVESRIRPLNPGRPGNPGTLRQIARPGTGRKPPHRT